MPLMFLNGGAMRGGELHHLLGGAPLVRVARTAARYRFYSVAGRFPALVPVPDPDSGLTSPGPGPGVSVAGELYDLGWSLLREDLLPAEPPELELGVIELDDGSGCLAMLRRAPFAEPPGRFTDISDFADWRTYLQARVRT
ncbi:MAG TPA: gamma-glutamylcyclotransferase [Actinocrinis sp.]|jgi:hypothetical protein